MKLKNNTVKPVKPTRPVKDSKTDKPTRVSL